MPNRGMFNTAVWNAEASGTILILNLSDSVGGVDGIVDARNFTVSKNLTDTMTPAATLAIQPQKVLLETLLLTQTLDLDLQKVCTERLRVVAWLTIRRKRRNSHFVERVL